MPSNSEYPSFPSGSPIILSGRKINQIINLIKRGRTQVTPGGGLVIDRETPDGTYLSIIRLGQEVSTLYVSETGVGTIGFSVKIDGVFLTMSDATEFDLDDTASPENVEADPGQFVQNDVTFIFTILGGSFTAMEAILYGKDPNGGPDYIMAQYSGPAFTGSFDYGPPEPPP